MKKLLIALLFLGVVSSHADDWKNTQVKLWKSSALQCGDYTNVLISSTPIIFHTVIGSPTILNAGNSQFVLNWSSAFPFLANVVSTKAFIPLDSTLGQMGMPYDVFITTGYSLGHVYSYFNKVGGACPIFYEWDYYNLPPERGSNSYFPKD